MEREWQELRGLVWICVHAAVVLAGCVIIDVSAVISESKAVTLLLGMGTGHLSSFGRPLSKLIGMQGSNKLRTRVAFCLPSSAHPHAKCLQVIREKECFDEAVDGLEVRLVEKVPHLPSISLWFSLVTSFYPKCQHAYTAH